MTDILLPPYPKKNDPDVAEKMRVWQRAYYARPENKERIRVYRAQPENKERRKKYTRAYYTSPENRERNKEQGRAYRARPENKERKRKNTLKREYGLTSQEVGSMIVDQNRLCFLCGKAPNGKRNNACLVVDHCHKTGKIRAMLCNKCNMTLGLVGESSELLRKMADYIETHKR